MLTCIVGKSNVDTFTYKEQQLREWSNKGMLKCPICGEKLLYCHGDFKIPYFRHEKNSNCPDIYSEGITEEHMEGIKILYYWLSNQNHIRDLQLEKWIPETRQRPDIYFKINDEEYVIEFQCSPISTKFNERHDLYKLQNIHDIWILGTDKYEIGEYNFIEKIEAKDLILNEIKTKTIERELYNSNNNVLYLKNNNLIKIRKIKDINYKTKFDICIDACNLNNCEISVLEQSISLFNIDYIPNYNLTYDLFIKIYNKLNNHSKNSFFKYYKNIKINKDGINFNLYRDKIINTVLKDNYIDMALINLKNIYKTELKMIYNRFKQKDIIRNKFIKLEEDLKLYIEHTSSNLPENDFMKLDYYNNNIQVKACLNNINRIIIIDKKEFELSYNKWESHVKFDGMSRKRRPKYSTGWHLEQIFSSKLINIEIKEVISFITESFTKEKQKKDEKIKKQNKIINTIKEYMLNNLNSYGYGVSDIECYYNECGNITIRIYSSEYGNRCFRIEDTLEINEMHKLDNFINITIDKIIKEKKKQENQIIREEKLKKEQEEINLKMNFDILNNNIKEEYKIFNVRYEENEVYLYLYDSYITDLKLKKQYILKHNKEQIDSYLSNKVGEVLNVENQLSNFEDICNYLFLLKKRYEKISTRINNNWDFWNCYIYIKDDKFNNVSFSIADRYNKDSGIEISIFNNYIIINDNNIVYNTVYELKNIIISNISEYVRKYKYKLR